LAIVYRTRDKKQNNENENKQQTHISGLARDHFDLHKLVAHLSTKQLSQPRHDYESYESARCNTGQIFDASQQIHLLLLQRRDHRLQTSRLRVQPHVVALHRLNSNTSGQPSNQTKEKEKKHRQRDDGRTVNCEVRVL
jgi:hypothetical protein